MSKQHNPTASTHPISILLANSRLLDLDKHDDWPDVSAQAFTGKDNPQNQKARIQSVEWVCYHLYQIWDSAECQNVSGMDPRLCRDGCVLRGPQKLQPFFPPLEPLQSINLRAALFRCLNELKTEWNLRERSHNPEVYVR